MGCQTAIAEQIVEQGGDYVLALKRNPGKLYAAVEQAFATASATPSEASSLQDYETDDAKPGRVEIRRPWPLDVPDGLEQKEAWSKLTSLGRGDSERQCNGKVTIEQRYYMVNEQDKTAVLTRLFEVEEITSALIFARTRMGTGELANELTVRGFPAEALNGDLNQEARERVLNRFRQNQITVLVATDVAARGLDIDNISHVFNFDLPGDSESYVHRVGRTARAGKTGIAISLVTPKEQWRLRRIEQYTKQRLTLAAVPTENDIQLHRQAQLVESMMVWLRRGRCTQEKEMVADLMAEGYDPIEVAAAALKLARAEEKQRPIARISPVAAPAAKRERRERKSNGRGDGRSATNASHEKGMVRLMLSVGKAHGVRPNDIVGSIAYHADIPGRAIGAIHIQDKQTLVDVPAEMVAQVLSKAGSYRLRKTAVTIEPAAM